MISKRRAKYILLSCIHELWRNTPHDCLIGKRVISRSIVCAVNPEIRSPACNTRSADFNSMLFYFIHITLFHNKHIYYFPRLLIRRRITYIKNNRPHNLSLENTIIKMDFFRFHFANGNITTSVRNVWFKPIKKNNYIIINSS